MATDAGAASWTVAFVPGDGAASGTTEAVVLASCCCCWMATDAGAATDGAAGWAAAVVFVSGDGAASGTTEAVVLASCCCCWMATDGAAGWAVVFASSAGAASTVAVAFSWLAPSGFRGSAAAAFVSVLRSFTYSCLGGVGSPPTASCIAAASAEENSAAVSPRVAGVRPMSASAEAPSPVGCGSNAVTEAPTSRSASIGPCPHGGRPSLFGGRDYFGNLRWGVEKSHTGGCRQAPSFSPSPSSRIGSGALEPA